MIALATALLVLQEVPGITWEPISATEWIVRCPTDKLGSDGKPLCHAYTPNFIPLISVDRTDEGMSIATDERCASVDRKNYLSEPHVVVPLKKGITREDRQKLFNVTLSALHAGVNSFCGYNRKPRELDQQQVATMLDAVFEKKSAAK